MLDFFMAMNYFNGTGNEQQSKSNRHCNRNMMGQRGNIEFSKFRLRVSGSMVFLGAPA